MGEWDQGLLGCFGNCGVCVVSYFLPCYQFGKNAEAAGSSCCCCCLMFFVPVANWIFMGSNRGKIREQQGIEGGCISDLCAAIFCPFCMLAQVGNEVTKMNGSMART